MEQERVGDSKFLRSPLWEKYQQDLGSQTWRSDEGSVCGFYYEYELPLVGKYAYAPRGPEVSSDVKEMPEDLSTFLQKAQNAGCGWVRIEPNSNDDLERITQALESLRATLVVSNDVQPRQTLCMNIAKSEEDILSEMKPKTRYNIRLAGKKGVEVFTTKEEKYLDVFYALIQETAHRAGIRAHGLEHYKQMLVSLPENAVLYGAKYQDDIIVMNLIIFYEGTAIYLHGGSSNEYRNIMAPFLLQWQIIQDAKERGCDWYDLGGVALDESVESHKKAWSGITRFKQGFCPDTEPITYPGTYDIILSPIKYSLYKGLSKIRSYRKKRA